jgi:hypothetical protein
VAETEPPAQKEWPPGVEPISYQNIARLGVGHDGKLYWDGRPVVTHSRLDLSCWQKVGAALAALAVFAGGLGSCTSGLDAGFAFGCKVHWWTVGCGSDEPNSPSSARIGTGAPDGSRRWADGR